MNSTWSRAERIPAGWLLGIIALWVGLPLLATVPATGALLDGSLVALSGLGLAAGGAWGWHRARIARLPLEISPVLLRGEVDGAPVWRVRARLGHGRPLREARARVRYLAEGTEVELSPRLAHAPLLFGPWTILVADPQRVVRAPGRLVVEVRAEERGRTWEQVASFDVEAARAGHFGPGFRVERGKLRFLPERWDEIVEDRC